MDVEHAGGTTAVVVNERINGSRWNWLGRYSFAAGNSALVRLRTTGTDGFVVADAVRFVPVVLPIVSVVANDPAASEPSGVGGDGTFTFTRSGSTAAALTVGFTVGGTATGASDYLAIPSPVAFAPGSATATRVITVIDDALVEGDETVELTLASGSEYTVGNPSSATVTIKDDDIPPPESRLTLDDAAPCGGVTVAGAWTSSTALPGYCGTGYQHDGNTGKGTKSMGFRPDLPAAGRYHVYLWWTANSYRASNVPVEIEHNGGTQTVTVNQRVNGSRWYLLGTWDFSAGSAGQAVIRTTGTDGFVTADGVKFVPEGSTVLDDFDPASNLGSVTYVGDWTASAATPGGWDCAGYHHDGNTGKGSKSVEFRPSLTRTGPYEVAIWYPADSGRADNVPVDVVHGGGTSTATVNQQIDGGQWVVLGTYAFAAGTSGYVRIGNAGTSGEVVADAVRFRPMMSPEVVVDEADPAGVTLVGTWTPSAGVAGYYDTGYLHDGNTGKGNKSIELRPTLSEAGTYEVYLWWTSNPQRASNVPVDVEHSGGTTTIAVNERANGGGWNLLGSFDFPAGNSGLVRVRTTGTDGYVVVDAARFVPAAGSGGGP